MLTRVPQEIRTYILVFLALLVLLAATVGVALIDLGALSAVAALTIAMIKAVLIMLFFMHLRGSSKVIWVFAAAGFFWLIILLLLTMADYLTRF